MTRYHVTTCAVMWLYMCSLWLTTCAIGTVMYLVMWLYTWPVLPLYCDVIWWVEMMTIRVTLEAMSHVLTVLSSDAVTKVCVVGWAASPHSSPSPWPCTSTWRQQWHSCDVIINRVTLETRRWSQWTVHLQLSGWDPWSKLSSWAVLVRSNTKSNNILDSGSPIHWLYCSVYSVPPSLRLELTQCWPAVLF